MATGTTKRTSTTQQCRFCASRISTKAVVCPICRRDLEIKQDFRLLDPRTYGSATIAISAVVGALASLWIYWNAIEPTASPELEILNPKCWKDKYTFIATNDGNRSAIVFRILHNRVLDMPGSKPTAIDLDLNDPIMVKPRDFAYVNRKISAERKPDDNPYVPFDEFIDSKSQVVCRHSLDVSYYKIESGADKFWQKAPRGFPSIETVHAKCSCETDPVTQDTRSIVSHATAGQRE